MEKAQQTCELWAQTYPRDAMPHAFLSGVVYPITANYEKAIEESSKVIALDPWLRGRILESCLQLRISQSPGRG
jgi:hypothetical protein